MGANGKCCVNKTHHEAGGLLVFIRYRMCECVLSIKQCKTRAILNEAKKNIYIYMVKKEIINFVEFIYTLQNQNKSTKTVPKKK